MGEFQGEPERPFLHLTESDPEKVRIAREIYDRGLALISEANADVGKMLHKGQGFIITLYDVDFDNVLPVIIKYAHDGVMMEMVEFCHRDAGPARALAFRLHPGIDYKEMLKRQAGAVMPAGKRFHS